jgi:hypothetical protein
MKNSFKIFPIFFLFIFFGCFSMAQASQSVLIQSLWPGTTVNVGDSIFFSASAYGFTNPSFGVEDLNLTSSVKPSSINGSGGFSWQTSDRDAGAHTIIITATDPLGYTASASVDITVLPKVSVSIGSASFSATSTITTGQNITFTAVPIGMVSPITYIITDSSLYNSINSSNIDSNGNFNWTPNDRDAGAHTMTVTATDSVGKSASGSITANVSRALSITLSPSYQNATINPNVTITFYILTSGFVSSPTFALSDYATSSLSSNNIDQSSDRVVWTPKVSDAGAHNIKITAVDSYGLSTSTTMKIIVSSSGNSTAILGVASQAISPVNNLVTTVSSVPSNSSVSSSNKYKFNKTLSFGSRGVDVTELQKRLIVEGFLSGTATGYFGTMTVAAVKKYQSHYGISQLGNVGPVTRGQLNK